MASLIPGYEYDIFISYRQKDNKGDKWVSKFVNELKTELESTFKEEISVYFDINSHDGLLETHDVDASLKDKLKCLVFIPVLSRTYCDPKSFAWEHEFNAFAVHASQDQFGLKVKLPNGNVASRVLPVRIHDLDDSDIKLCEAILGGALRGVEFIYKEPGVNRSLTPADDDKQNLNNTRYRNQMNKVALAIKDIILGLKALSELPSSKQSTLTIKPDNREGYQVKSARSGKLKLLSAVVLTAFIAIAVIFLFPKIFKPDKFRNLKDQDGKISIAVMPFNNLTGDTTLNWFGRGISSLIINGLGNSPELSVADEYTLFEVFENMNQATTTGISESLAKEASGKIGTDTYISGSFHGTGNLYWILVNLVNTKTGDIIWTNKIQGDLKSAGYLDMANGLCDQIKNCLEIKALEKNADYDFRETYPKSSEAYRYFIEGMNGMMHRQYGISIASLKKALNCDSTFTFASFFLAWAYSTTDQDSLAREWTRKAYVYKERIPPEYQPWLEQWYAFYVSKNLEDILRYTEILENSGIRSRWLWYDIGATYCNVLQLNERAIHAFKKVIEISDRSGGYWKDKSFYLTYSKILHKTGQHKEEKDLYRIYLDLFPDDTEILGNMATCSLSRGETATANHYIRKIKSQFNTGLIEENSLEMILGNIYLNANYLDEAEVHFRKAYELDIKKKDPGRKVNFDPAYCLSRLIINNENDISEGMEIVNKNLELNKDDWRFLDIKGWGLYRQGKYGEAIQYLKMAEQKSIFFDFEVHLHIQEVEKAISSQHQSGSTSVR